MINPYTWLIALVLWVATVAGSYWYGTGVGKDSEIAKASEIKQAIVDTREAAKLGAADAIAKIKVRNTTVQGQLNTVIKESPVYVDCKHSPDALRLLNEALTGTAGGSGTGRNGSNSVPSTVSPVR